MLSELHTAHKVIGVKQTKKRPSRTAKPLWSMSRSTRKKRVTGPIYELCTENHVQMVEITTMAELGDAVGTTSARPSSRARRIKLLRKRKRFFHIYF